MARKYGKKSQDMVKSAMRKMKKGKLKSGKGGKKVTERKQAIAIGLSEAREKGAKVPAPEKKVVKKTTARKKTTKARTTKKKTTAKKK
jgi:hypothetical protein